SAASDCALADWDRSWRGPLRQTCSALQHPAAIRLPARSAFDGARAIACPEGHDDVAADPTFGVLEGEERSHGPTQPAMGTPPDEVGAIRHLGQADVKGVQRRDLVELIEGEGGGGVADVRRGQPAQLRAGAGAT